MGRPPRQKASPAPMCPDGPDGSTVALGFELVSRTHGIAVHASLDVAQSRPSSGGPSRLDIQLEEHLVEDRDPIDLQPFRIARRGTEDVLHDPEHPKATALVEPECAGGGCGSGDDQPMAVALATERNSGLYQLAADPFALARLDHGEALEFAHARLARFEDLSMPNDIRAIPGDEDFAQSDVLGDVRSRVIGETEELEQRTPISCKALDSHWASSNGRPAVLAVCPFTMKSTRALSPLAAHHSAIAPRPDPERLYAARRAGLTTRLINEARLSPETAETWVVAWEAERALRGVGRRSMTFWDGAWRWIAVKRSQD